MYFGVDSGRPTTPVAGGTSVRPLRRIGILILLAVLLAASNAFAADVPAQRASARATMKTFLGAVTNAAQSNDESKLDAAVDCLDLSRAPGLDRAARRDLAIQLKEIIDRTRYVDYAAVPDSPDAPPYIFARGAAGEIVIAGSESDDWQFTPDTVESIPAMLKEAMGRERVSGAADVPDYQRPVTWLRHHIPTGWRQNGFLLEHWQWIGLVMLALLGVIADRMLVALLLNVARPIARRLIPDATPNLLTRGARPAGLLTMGVIWRVGVPWLGLPPEILSIVLLAVTFVVAVSAVWLAYRSVDVGSEYLAHRASLTATRYDDLLVPLLRKSAKIIVVAFGLVFIADNLNVNITSLVAGLGLGGLAFALAAQDVVKNLFGSITVLLDRPFHVGDWVSVDGVEGTVEEVGFRSTRIRTPTSSLVTLPNANLLSSSVDNLGARRFRRWKTTLSLTYDTPAEKIDAFCEGVRELVRRHPMTRKDVYHVYANEFGAASLDVLLYIFFETNDYGVELRERHRFFLDVLRLADRLGVEFAFPTQTLHVFRPGEMPDHGEQPPLPEGRERARALAGEIAANPEEGPFETSRSASG